VSVEPDGEQGATMPYVMEKYEGPAAKTKAENDGWLEPNMRDVREKVERLELLGSSFSDPGADFCEWIAYDENGAILSTRTINGY